MGGEQEGKKKCKKRTRRVCGEGGSWPKPEPKLHGLLPCRMFQPEMNLKHSPFFPPRVVYT